MKNDKIKYNIGDEVYFTVPVFTTGKEGKLLSVIDPSFIQEATEEHPGFNSVIVYKGKALSVDFDAEERELYNIRYDIEYNDNIYVEIVDGKEVSNKVFTKNKLISRFRVFDTLEEALNSIPDITTEFLADGSEVEIQKLLHPSAIK